MSQFATGGSGISSEIADSSTYVKSAQTATLSHDAGMSNWGPRPALDGLRFVAVYLVVFFHGGVAIFSGGFIGVDLFFVLSGFLVTTVVLVDIDNHGQFRLARFYARRIRRLLPAATVAIVGTACAFVLVASPVERVATIGDARSPFLYFANWHFLFRSNDYFASDAAAASPFLHFWSLSIEEQFYFVFPLVLIALVVLARRSGRAALLPLGFLALAYISLVIQIIVARRDPQHAYYGTDARLYQLLVGATLGAGFRRYRMSRRLRSLGGLGAVLGLFVFILLSTSLFETSPSTRGILATIFAATVVVYLELNTTSRIARILSLSKLRYLGQISYGTYLWHWPVVIVAKRVSHPGPWVLALIAIVVGTALAALSNEIIELPLRRSPRLDRYPRTVVTVGLVIGVLGAFVVVPAVLKMDQKPVISFGGRVVAAGGQDFGPVPENLDLERTNRDLVDMTPDCLGKPVEACVVVRGDGPHIHLLGDSHARMLLPLFEELALQRGFSFSASVASSCPWQNDLLLRNAVSRQSACEKLHRDQYERVIPELNPDVVVVISIALDDPSKQKVLDSSDEALAGLSNWELTSELSGRSIHQLKEAGSRVVVLEPVPFGNFDSVSCLSAADQLIECAFEDSPDPLSSEIAYRNLDLEDESVFSLDLDPIVCPDLPICLPVVDGLAVRHDRTHLASGFVRAIVGKVGKVMDKAGVFEGLSM